MRNTKNTHNWESPQIQDTPLCLLMHISRAGALSYTWHVQGSAIAQLQTYDILRILYTSRSFFFTTSVVMLEVGGTES